MRMFGRHLKRGAGLNLWALATEATVTGWKNLQRMMIERLELVSRDQRRNEEGSS